MVEHPLPRRVIVGEPAEEAVPRLLRALSASRVLVVTDAAVGALEKTGRLVSALRSSFQVGVFSDVPPEPPVEVADRVAEAARSLGADALVAVGGGSVIDAAKAGLVRYATGRRVEDVNPFEPLGLDPRGPVLVAVPTTSGTGSDASHGIVLVGVEDGSRTKIAVGSPEVVPYATVLDPDYPASAPRRVKIAAAMDALAHSLEALVAAQATPLTDALATAAARIILTRLPAALEGDTGTWLHIHSAATMAGMAFTGAGLGLVHAVAHPLGGRLGLPHGVVVGVLLPAALRLYQREPRASAKLAGLQAILENVDGLPAAEGVAGHVERLAARIGFPLRFRDHGVGEEDFMEAARYAAEAAYRDPDMAFSPVIPSPEEILEMLRRLY